MKDYWASRLLFILLLFTGILLGNPVQAADSLENSHLKIILIDNGSIRFYG